MPLPPEQGGPGASSRASRFGPGLSLLGVALWIATIAAYVMLRPEPTIPGAAFRKEDGMRFLMAFVVTGLGVCIAWSVSAVGFFLSLSERKHRPGKRATRGIVLGGIGVAVVGIVVIEILRVAFTTT